MCEWKAAGTYVVGLSHEKKNIGCQDRFVSTWANRVTCISISDGAGSANFAEIGAEITTNQINNTITNKFDLIYALDENKAKLKLISDIKAKLKIQAKIKLTLLENFASTLIFASVKGDKFIAGHIGDGILGIIENERITLLSSPDNGEFINETYFVTSKFVENRFKIFRGCLNDISGFVLMSDGTCESLFDKKSNSIAPIVKTLFSWLDNFNANEVNKALHDNFENVVKHKTNDDCSIGLMKLSKPTFLLNE